MPDYYARPIPHLKGLHRDLALRKQHLGLYDGVFVREAGKFLNGYDMAASSAVSTQAYPYPAWMKKLRQSVGWISSVAMAQALQRPSTVRRASLRKMVLNLAKACSIGSRSGL